MFYFILCLGGLLLALYLRPQLRAAFAQQRLMSEKLHNLLFIAAGAAPELLRQCSVITQVAHGALGLTMLLIAILAGCGMGLSIYEFTQNPAIAWLAGSFWMLLILAVDRQLVIAINKTDDAWKLWLKAAPRLAMVFVLGFVVSHTLIQGMFRNDIEREMVEMRAEQVRTLSANDDTQIEELRNRIKAVNEQITATDNEITESSTALAKEIAGEVGSGKRGDGKVAAAWRAKIQQAQARREQLLNERQQIEDQIRAVEQIISANLQNNAKALNAPAGLLGRSQAVSRICRKNPEANLLKWALMLGLFLLESSPVLAKLLNRASSYDQLVEREQLAENVTLMVVRKAYEHLLSDDPDKPEYQSEAMKQIRRDIEERLSSGLNKLGPQTKQAQTIAAECCVNIYLCEPGKQREQQRLFINFPVAKEEVFGAHLMKALTLAGAKQGYDLFNWLTPGYFELLNPQGETVKLEERLFPQLQNDTAFVVPVIH